MLYITLALISFYQLSFLSSYSRLSADSETWCIIRAVIQWEDVVSCGLSVSHHCLLKTDSITSSQTE